MNLKKSARGFTLIEILVVIGIIAILAAIVIVAINPSRQFAQARNSQRTSNVNAILNAIGQRMADNKGEFRSPTDTTCTLAMDLTIPMSSSTISQGGKNIRPCISPTYIPEVPVDPSDGVVWNGTTYDTKYQIARDANGRVTVCAPEALEPSIAESAQICVTR